MTLPPAALSDLDRTMHSSATTENKDPVQYAMKYAVCYSIRQKWNSSSQRASEWHSFTLWKASMYLSNLSRIQRKVGLEFEARSTTRTFHQILMDEIEVPRAVAGGFGNFWNCLPLSSSSLLLFR